MPRQFDESSFDYAWVMWPRADGGNSLKMATGVRTYDEWVMNKGEWTWLDLMRALCTHEDGAHISPCMCFY